MLVEEAKEEVKNNFSKDIGGVKYETKKKPINKKIMFFFKNDSIEFFQPHVNIIEMKNEYDVNEMKATLQKI